MVPLRSGEGVGRSRLEVADAEVSLGAERGPESQGSSYQSPERAGALGEGWKPVCAQCTHGPDASPGTDRGGQEGQGSSCRAIKLTHRMGVDGKGSRGARNEVG